MILKNIFFIFLCLKISYYFFLNDSSYAYLDSFVFSLKVLEPLKFCCILKLNYKLCLLYVEISHHGTIYMSTTMMYTP